MPLVTTTEMFKKAYEGKYAIGAFNVNNMEMIQAIVEAANEEKSPVILQVYQVRLLRLRRVRARIPQLFS